MDIYAQSMPPCDKSSNQIDRRSICKLKLKQIKLEGKHDLAPLTASSIQFSYFSKLRAIDFLCPGPHIKPMLQGHKKNQSRWPLQPSCLDFLIFPPFSMEPLMYQI